MGEAEDEQQIRDVISTWMKAAADGDLETILGLMTEDVVFLQSGQSPMRGQEAFAAGFKVAMQHIRIEGFSNIQEIQILGDHACCWNQLSVTAIPLKEGVPRVREGAVLSIFRKESDGRWRLFRDANLLA